MQLQNLDWAIIIAVLLFIVGTGLYLNRRASKDSSGFFLGNRNMPWWLLGTSMVATTFAADTPNLVTGLVRQHGVAGNWGWWAFLITGMLSAFIYAKLWRRLGVTTDIEFYELRYSGKPASFLRGFRAVYIGVFFNMMVMANVTLALIKYGNVLFGISPILLVTIAGIVTVLLSASGGLLGVLITDFFLFGLAMVGAIAVAIFAVSLPEVGGLAQMMSHPAVIEKSSFLPDMRDPSQYVPLLLIPLLVQWWAAWYPGAEPGGGGYVAQRMLAAKDEKNATKAAVFFNVAHYALRPWPWILVALASLIVYPDLASIKTALPHIDEGLIDHDLAYPAMLIFLPSGLLGLTVASILAAYISTISTMLNLGSSYVVNDVYSRFINRNASEARKIMAARISTVIMMVGAALLALVLQSATQAFHLLLAVGAGTGFLFFARWFWMRINAWSEISAMVFSLGVAGWLEFFGPDGLESWQKFLLSVGLTTVGWILVTLLTAPTSPEKQRSFKASIKAAGAGEGHDLRSGIIAALSASVAVYGLLFATGSILYGNMVPALVFGCIALAGGLICWRQTQAGSRKT
ncbi:MAG: Na+:solute symporter [Robiginitomaculum sp.]|nr:MAG: Na+:solute symporter [Robiginitomaculum sp.]